MIKLEINEVRNTIIQAGILRGLSESDAAIVADDLIDAEISGVETHGIGKFLVIGEAIQEREGDPEILKETEVLALVDGHRELGYIAANFCIDLVVSKAKAQGIGLVALKQASRYGRLAPYTRKIAKEGLIGVVMNSAGPAGVAPYGGYTAILGTNPISFAFPRKSEPAIVLDFTTAERPWGDIRQSMLEGKDLPRNAFYDSAGEYAVNPKDTHSVKAFGGAKGFALCLAIEILCGVTLGTSMGTSVGNEYDLGFLFFAINPEFFRENMAGFYSELDSLVDEIRESKPLSGIDSVRVPGDRSNERRSASLRSGMLELDENTWQILKQMAADPSAGIASNFLTN